MRQGGPGQAECDSAIRTIEGALPALNSPSAPVSDMSFFDCLDTIIEGSKALGAALIDLGNQVRADPPVRVRPISRLNHRDCACDLALVLKNGAARNELSELCVLRLSHLALAHVRVKSRSIFSSAFGDFDRAFDDTLTK